ncbi:MAG TPA: carbonic anhydrase [Bacillales bacterium]|nr:carbonic anhydrase [Bacillales bacterium]
MSTISQILEHNQKFVEEKGYEPYKTDKYPNRKIVVFSCMDTRLSVLLPKAMGLDNGDAKVVKNAGAIIENPYDSVVSSIFVGLWQLRAEEVVVVGHRDCGMAGLKGSATIEKMKENGITEETFKEIEASGVDVEKWLSGIESIEGNVQHSVDMLKQHPLLPKGTKVHGLVIDPGTGKLDLVHEDK